MKKVISFSLWGNDPKYCVGAIKNAELAQLIYADWTCRFYVGFNVPMSVQAKLAGMNNVELSEIPPDLPGWQGMFARFFPISEPEIDIVMVRDCDSRLGTREKSAVEEWMGSHNSFHVMRDHVHHSVPIMGGLFGVKGTLPFFEEEMRNWPKEDRWQTDQEFLTAKIWPKVKQDCLVHDSWRQNAFGAISKSFPTSLQDSHFVGASYDEQDVINRGQVLEMEKYDRYSY